MAAVDSIDGVPQLLGKLTGSLLKEPGSIHTIKNLAFEILLDPSRQLVPDAISE
jgi:hypothetical protein